MNIEIAPNSRTFIVGMTGSGKTYLAKQMLVATRRLIVFDTKENLAKPMNLQRGTYKNWSRFIRGLSLRIQVKDSPENENRAEYFNKMCYRIRESANCMLYIDEVLDVLGSSYNPEYHLRSLFSKGREPITNSRGEIVSGNIGVVASTQRPSRIPLIMLTEAENIFCFRLQNPDDRKTIAGYMGLSELPQIHDEHGFYYFNKSMAEPVYIPEL